VPAIVEKQKALLPAAPPGWQVTGETVYGDHGIEFRSAEREFAKGAVRARVRFHPMPAAEAAGFRRALDAPAEPGAADLAGSFAGRPALLTGSGTIIVPLNRGGFQLWIGPPVGDPVPPRGWAKDFERALDLDAIEKALGALHE
jgi:hypothetical protein